MDVPIGKLAGVSGRRQRLWGLVAAVMVCGVGAGTFAVLGVAQDTPIHELWGAPSRLVSRRAMTMLDYYFLGLVGLGLVFLEGAIVALRVSRFPRTDGSGAALLGTALCAIGGLVLFARVWAVAHG